MMQLQSVHFNDIMRVYVNIQPIFGNVTSSRVNNDYFSLIQITSQCLVSQIVVTPEKTPISQLWSPNLHMGFPRTHFAVKLSPLFL